MLDDQRAEILHQDQTVTGFNVGINASADAGQTIFHIYVHLIPRCHPIKAEILNVERKAF